MLSQSHIANYLSIAKAPKLIGLAPSVFSILAGLIASLNFAPYNLSIPSILGLAVLFFNLRKATLLKGTVFVYLFWASYFISGMLWIRNGVAVFSHISFNLATIITLGFGLIYAIILSILWLLVFVTKTNSLGRFCCISGIWTLSEWLRYYLFDGLPWLIQGYGHQSSWLSGWIPVLGVLGASFFSVVSALSIVECLANKQRSNRCLFLFIFCVVWLAGYALAKVEWTDSMGTNIPVRAIQPNFPLDFESSLPTAEKNQYRINALESESEGFWQGGLMIWPEGSVRLKPEKIQAYVSFADKKAKAHKTAFFTSAPYYPDTNTGDVAYNSILGLGLAAGKYHKVHRAPLGEYAPLGGRLGKLLPLFNTSKPPERYSSGSQAPIEFSYLNQKFLISGSVCYEIAFGEHLRKMAKQSNLLLNLSNDIWFDGTHELDQALQIAQIRALEHQKPLIRSGNSGITALIDYKGNVVKQIPRETKAVLVGEIAPRTGQTPYSRWGDAPILGLSLLMLVYGLVCYFRRQRLNSD